jgi:TonB family protein
MTSHEKFTVSSREASVTNSLARWLIQCAARQAPQGLAERLAEEWQADLTGRPRGLARVLFASGCYWASVRMAYDPLIASANQVVATGGANSHAVLGGADPTFFSRRTMVFIAILALHALAIYGFASGFAQNAITKVLPKRTTIHVIEQPRRPEAPLPKFVDAVPAVTKAATPDQIGFLSFSIPQPPVDTSSGRGDLLLPLEHTAGGAVRRVSGGPGAGFPSTRDFYSAEAIRRELSGVTAVRVCVDRSGHLTSDPIVANSSGYAILDRDALALARAGSGHYRSTTANGVPIDDCYAYRVRFELH